MGRMKFNVSTVLFAILLLAVSLGWLAERYRNSRDYNQYFATIVTPEERAVLRPNGALHIEGVFLHRSSSEADKAPHAIVELVSPSGNLFVIQNSFGTLTSRKKSDPRAYEFECEIPERKGFPYPPGEYSLRVKFFLDGKLVVSPMRTMLVVPEPSETTDVENQNSSQNLSN